MTSWQKERHVTTCVTARLSESPSQLESGSPGGNVQSMIDTGISLLSLAI